jgi:4-hydroxy-3-polyprenylbenzoate decarboxylase
LRRIVDSYWTINEPCPIAVAIGADPYTLLAACTSIPDDQDEFSLAGALKRTPIELVPCETVPLEVPVGAEIILEGWIHPNDELEEGPFAETSGYYSDPRIAPVITLSTITCRENPVFHDIVTGVPPDENQAMLVTHQAQAFKLATQMFPDSVIDVYLSQGGCVSFNAVVRMKKRFAGEPKQVGIYMLTVMPRLKNIWIVDEDIDSNNPIQVEWAYTTRCRGSRDITIINAMKGVPLDPCTINGVVDKLVFDCTKPFQNERFPGEREVIPCY